MSLCPCPKCGRITALWYIDEDDQSKISAAPEGTFERWRCLECDLDCSEVEYMAGVRQTGKHDVWLEQVREAEERLKK